LQQVDSLTATTGAALAGGEPSDEAALWEYGVLDRGAVASGGMAEAVDSTCGTRVGADGSYPKPCAQPEKIIVRWTPSMGV